MAKHEKLTDLLDKGMPLLGTKTNSFKEAYPAISKLRVEVAETELMWPKEHGTRILTEENFRHAVNCSNPMCHGGGVEIGNILYDIISKRLTHYEEGYRCRGYEGSPKGRRRDRSCMHKFIVKIDIVYESA